MQLLQQSMMKNLDYKDGEAKIMIGKINHGHKKGDKILYSAGSFGEYITYLGESQLDDACFIAEDVSGYVADDWFWSEVVEQEVEE